MNARMSGCSSGSPPDTQTPSSLPLRLARNAKKSSVDKSPVVSEEEDGAAIDVFLGASSDEAIDSASWVTSDALWQKGQRKLHPTVKTVQATLPGKSKRVTLCKPRNRISAPLSEEILRFP